MDHRILEELCPSGRPCRIEATEQRGVSLAQLVAVVEQLRQHCGKSGAIPGWVDSRSDSPVHLQTANLYHLNDNFIIPCTAAFECSFVEMVASCPEEQRPEYFVSHWWGEPVVHFVMCLQHFAATRRLSRPVFWVCAYANNQHRLHADVAGDPADSSFRRALDLCKGTLMVLDSDATPFSRVWCTYEVFTSFSEPEKIFDFATFVPEAGEAVSEADYAGELPEVSSGSLHIPGRVELITQGFVPGDHEGKGKSVKAGHVTRPNASPADMKAEREASFPMSIVLRAIETRVQSAAASIDLDRMRILNAIAGSERLDQEPPAAHPRYDAVNTAIHSRFAAAVFVNGARGRAEHAGRLLRAICGDASRTELDLQVTNSNFSDAMLQELAECLPSGIESLGFGLGGTLAEDAGVIALGKAMTRLTALRHFSLYVNSRTLTSAAVLALGAGVGTLARISNLSLYFTGTLVADSGVSALARGLAGRRLERLELGFSYTHVTENGLAPIAEALEGNNSLKSLSVTANSTKTGGRPVAAIAARAAGMTGLRELWLGFAYTRVDDGGARAAFEAAGKLCGSCLTEVYLDFGHSSVTIPALARVTRSPAAVMERLAAAGGPATPVATPAAATAASESRATRNSLFRCCHRRVHPLQESDTA